jgi:hypothetical protein
VGECECTLSFQTARERTWAELPVWNPGQTKTAENATMSLCTAARQRSRSPLAGGANTHTQPVMKQ